MTSLHLRGTRNGQYPMLCSHQPMMTLILDSQEGELFENTLKHYIQGSSINETDYLLNKNHLPM